VTAPIIVLHGVLKLFGRHPAVQDLDLVLHPGECVGLVGHNGAGKSTIIKMMLGLLRPTKGKVETLGENPAAGTAARARRELGYLPENVSLYPSMTGAETLAFYARLKRQPVAGNRALLERVGLGAAARQRVGTYSKGMRQRLGLAQALLGQPRALLLDEPTAGLDPALRQSFYEILRDVRAGGGTVLLSSHALAELEGEVDRIVVMHLGRKMADGSIHDLRKLAGMSARVRIRVPEGRSAELAQLRDWSALPGRILETRCDETRILALLRALPDWAEDVEVLRPSLDEVYASFLGRGDQKSPIKQQDAA
jgi:Cu-processing system ATP-binding protein